MVRIEDEDLVDITLSGDIVVPSDPESIRWVYELESEEIDAMRGRHGKMPPRMFILAVSMHGVVRYSLQYVHMVRAEVEFVSEDELEEEARTNRERALERDRRGLDAVQYLPGEMVLARLEAEYDFGPEALRQAMRDVVRAQK